MMMMMMMMMMMDDDDGDDDDDDSPHNFDPINHIRIEIIIIIIIIKRISQADLKREIFLITQ